MHHIPRHWSHWWSLTPLSLRWGFHRSWQMLGRDGLKTTSCDIGLQGQSRRCRGLRDFGPHLVYSPDSTAQLFIFKLAYSQSTWTHLTGCLRKHKSMLEIMFSTTKEHAATTVFSSTHRKLELARLKTRNIIKIHLLHKELKKNKPQTQHLNSLKRQGRKM